MLSQLPINLSKVSKKYRLADINYAIDLLTAADVKERSEAAVKILLKIKRVKELFKSELVEMEKEVSREIKRIVDAHRQKALSLDNGKILFYEIKSGLAVRGSISDALQQMYPGKIVIIGEIENTHYALSFGTITANVDFPTLIRKSIENMEGAHGGGHAKAAGCKIKLEDKERFLERFIRYLNNKYV